MTAALEGGEWSAARPGRTLPPGETRYRLYRRLGGPQGRSGRTENLVPTGIRSPDRPARSQSLYRLGYPAHRRIRKLRTILTCKACCKMNCIAILVMKTIWGGKSIRVALSLVSPALLRSAKNNVFVRYDACLRFDTISSAFCNMVSKNQILTAIH